MCHIEKKNTVLILIRSIVEKLIVQWVGNRKWKKKNKSQRIKRLLFLFPLVRSRQNSMADVS